MLFNSKKYDIYKKLGFLLIFAQSSSAIYELSASITTSAAAAGAAPPMNTASVLSTATLITPPATRSASITTSAAAAGAAPPMNTASVLSTATLITPPATRSVSTNASAAAAAAAPMNTASALSTVMNLYDDLDKKLKFLSTQSSSAIDELSASINTFVATNSILTTSAAITSILHHVSTADGLPMNNAAAVFHPPVYTNASAAAAAAPMNNASALSTATLITPPTTRSVSTNASAAAAAAAPMNNASALSTATLINLYAAADAVPSTINANLIAASLFSAARALPPAVRDRLSVIATIFSKAPIIASASDATAKRIMLIDARPRKFHSDDYCDRFFPVVSTVYELPSYFVNRDFTAEEIAELKSIDPEIIESMDRVWGKIGDSKFNKEYIKSCLKVVRRTWRLHPDKIQVDLTMDEIVRCLYMPLVADSLNRESLKDVIRVLELVSEKSFKTALEIFAKLNKHDIYTWRRTGILHYRYRKNEIIWELTSKFYKVSSNDIFHIAYMINCYIRIGSCGYIQGFDYFKDKNSIPEYYKFFYPYNKNCLTLTLTPFHGMQGLPDVVTIKFSPTIRGYYDRPHIESIFVEFIIGHPGVYSFFGYEINCFKELRIQFIDVKSGSSAQYERYALKNGEYYNISNGNKLLSTRDFIASREKNDPFPKIIYQ